MAVDLSIVRATPDHVGPIADRMRAQDVAEVWAGSHSLPAKALAYSIERSEYAMTATVDGVPACAFGVVPASLATGVGLVWLLGTDDVVRHSRLFLRESLRWRDMLLRRHPLLRNVVDERNTVSRRWLGWMGATFSDPIPMGPDNLPFRVFELRASHV